jgi:hypothetical protein
MHVAFKRTGTRRYAVIVTLPGEPPRAFDPAPGYDHDIPHDLVHYVVEAELALKSGVYGSAARGGGTFVSTAEHDLSSRERARKQRRQQKREQALRAHDARHGGDMAQSERLAAVCDVAWRRRHGQSPAPDRNAPVLQVEDAAHVERVLTRLDSLAPLWRELPIDGELVFEWPSARPCQTLAAS